VIDDRSDESLTPEQIAAIRIREWTNLGLRTAILIGINAQGEVAVLSTADIDQDLTSAKSLLWLVMDRIRLMQGFEDDNEEEIPARQLQH
jgi:hypothetical protein